MKQSLIFLGLRFGIKEAYPLTVLINTNHLTSPGLPRTWKKGDTTAPFTLSTKVDKKPSKSWQKLENGHELDVEKGEKENN